MKRIKNQSGLLTSGTFTSRFKGEPPKTMSINSGDSQVNMQTQATQEPEGITKIQTDIAGIAQTMQAMTGVIQQLSQTQAIMQEAMANGGKPPEPIKWASKQDAELMKDLTPQQAGAIRRAMSQTGQQHDQTQDDDGVLFVGVDNTSSQHQETAKKLSMTDVVQMGDTYSGNVKQLGGSNG